jgi:hypothetical protein
MASVEALREPRNDISISLVPPTARPMTWRQDVTSRMARPKTTPYVSGNIANEQWQIGTGLFDLHGVVELKH